MFCPQCGAPAATGAQFCAICGAALTSPDAPVERVRPPLITILAVLKGLAALWWLALGLVLITVGRRGPDNAILLPFGIFCLVISLFEAVCLAGLWTLRPFGRTLQIAFSVAGLLFFPVGTLISILVLVYMFNPGVRLLFSHKAVEAMTPQERSHVRSLAAWSTGALVIGIVAAVFVLVAMTGVIAAIAIPNFLNAIDRGKQKRTMADMRTIAEGVEAYKREFNNQYPTVPTAADMRQALEPRFLRSFPVKDGWGNDFVLESSPDAYTIFSHGKDGIGSDCEPAVTTSFNDEICFQNGKFVRHPQGVQH
jgi:general secretion pathway protein G